MDHRHIFTASQISDTPSRKGGISKEKEDGYRKQCSYFIQDIGIRLLLSQYCINLAVIYMQIFYMHHSFSVVPRFILSMAAVLLAGKANEEKCSIEQILKMGHFLLNRKAPNLDVRSKAYAEMKDHVFVLESDLLAMLGFKVTMELPNSHVDKICKLIKGSEDLERAANTLVNMSLQITTLSIEYPPQIVASVCFHLACKWLGLKIHVSEENKEWFYYSAKLENTQLLEKLAKQFLDELGNVPDNFNEIHKVPSACLPKITAKRKRDQDELGVKLDSETKKSKICT